MEYAVAIDFDGTIVENRFPNIGRIKPNAEYAINWLKQHYDRVYLWTCRYDGDNQSSLADAYSFLEANGIFLDQPQEWKGVKKVAQFYIDDRSVPGFLGWLPTMYIISKVEDKPLPDDFSYDSMVDELGMSEYDYAIGFLQNLVKFYQKKYFN